ncbi:TonB-dependent receptor [Porphyromonas pogonae]|nr:TonB-dependent receptor [Porphyromonas pogonae]
MCRKKNFIVIVIALMLGNSLGMSLMAQQRILMGKVKDAKTSEAIIGASVKIIGTNLGCVTNEKGEYTLRLTHAEPKVMVSSMGYQSQTFTPKLSDTQDINHDFLLIQNFNALNEVTIYAKEREREEIRAVKKSGIPVSVIDGRLLAARGTTIEQVLNTQTGVKIRRTGGVGSSAKINIRGLEGKRVQVYIDGYALNTNDGGFNINDIPLQFIDRIEIYKGIVPPEFGGDGLGSAVNVVTIDPKDGYVDFASSVASYGDYAGNITLNHYYKPLKSYISAFLGGKYALNNYKMESPIEKGLVIKRDHDRLKMIEGALTLKSKDLYFDQLELENFFYISDKQIQGVLQNIRHAKSWGVGIGLNPKLEKSNFLINGLNLKLYGLAAYSNLGQIDTAKYITDFHGHHIPGAYAGEVGMIPNDSHDKLYDWRYNLNLKYEIIPEKMFLNLNNGFRTVHTVSQDTVADRFLNANYSGLKSDIYDIITSLSLENNWFDRKFSTILTGRHYYYALEGNTIDLAFMGEAKPQYISTNGSYWGGSYAMKYSFTNHWLLKTALEFNYRLPRYEEALGDRMTTLTSLGLKPESAFNFNLGLMFDKYYAASSRIQFDANTYFSKIKNMIYPSDYVGYILYKNLGKAVLYGFDAEVKWDINQNWFVSSNITWQKSLDDERFQPGTSSHSITYHKQLPHIPVFFVNWTADYRTQNPWGLHGQYARFYYEGGFTDTYYYGFKLSSQQQFTIPAATIHSVGAEWGFMNRKILVGCECRNLFDSRELTNFNYPLPGRTLMLKVRFTTLK